MAGSQPNVTPITVPTPCGACPRCGSRDVVHMPAKETNRWVCHTDPAHSDVKAPGDGKCPACARAGVESGGSVRLQTRAAVCFCMGCNRAFPRPE